MSLINCFMFICVWNRYVSSLAKIRKLGYKLSMCWMNKLKPPRGISMDLKNIFEGNIKKYSSFGPDLFYFQFPFFPSPGINSLMEHTRFAQANEKATYTFLSFFFLNFEAKLLVMLFKEDKSLAIRLINVS